MTVKDLKEAFAKYPDDMEIVVNDSYWGMVRITDIIQRNDYLINRDYYLSIETTES